MESLSNNVQSKRITSNPISDNHSHASDIDISKIINDSNHAIKNEKPKRVRRTKAQIEADKLNPQASTQTTAVPNQPIQPVDRTKELKPAFLLYSDLLIAKPLECADLKLSDEEAEALAQCTSNLMNAFPEYFNSADPKVAAIFGACFTILPVGYSKYRIYQQHKISKTLDKVKNDA